MQPLTGGAFKMTDSFSGITAGNPSISQPKSVEKPSGFPKLLKQKMQPLTGALR